MLRVPAFGVDTNMELYFFSTIIGYILWEDAASYDG